MRKEILDFLTQGSDGIYELINEDRSLVEKIMEFKHSQVRDELVVEAVYVRIYTEQPQYELRDKVIFCKGLVTYLYETLLGPQNIIMQAQQ